MAEKGSTTTTAQAPPAPADDLVDLTMPEGMTVEEFAVQEPEAPAQPDKDKPEAAAAPAAAAPAAQPEQPAPAKPEKKGDLGKALQESRGREKKLKAENARLRKNTWEGIEAERQQGMAKIQARPEPQLTNLPKAAEDKLRYDRTRLLPAMDQAEAQAKPISAHIAPVLDETERLMRESAAEAQRLAQEAHTKAVQQIGVYHQRAQEAELKEDLAEEGINYDEVLREAGIWDALMQDAQGNYRDPLVARAIYGSANPAKRAFRLAQDKLEYLKRGKAGDEGEEQPEAPAPSVAKPAAPAAQAPAPKPDQLAEARREGARETADVMTQNSQRPRGLKVLQRAGEPPKAGLSPDLWEWIDKRLDSPSESEREQTLRFLELNPRVNTFYLNGRPKP